MLTCQREAFRLPTDVHYLNCAYMSPLARRVEEAGIEGIRRKRDPSSIEPADFFDNLDRVRGLFARVINVPDPSRVALIPSVSYGLATVARNLPVPRGRTIVVGAEQFPSNVYCWRRLADEMGASLRTVARPATGDWTSAVAEVIGPDVAVVAIGGAHWTDGGLLDLEEIGERTRECGAALVVDGTQSIGAVPFDVARIRPAAVVCAAYKWLLGPYSVGLAYFDPRFEQGTPLEETWMSRPGSEEFSGLVRYRDGYQPGARRYDVGEASNFILVPMVGEALSMLLEWGIPRIAAYCLTLTRRIAEAAGEWGYGVAPEDLRAPHILGVRAPRKDVAERLRALLQENRVRVSFRGDAVRIAPNVYNDESDVAPLVDALRRAARS